MPEHSDAPTGVAGSAQAIGRAVVAGERARAAAILEAEPGITNASVHVAAVAGDTAAVKRHLARDASLVRSRLGPVGGDPLLWLCYSPFHGESRARDDALAATARVLLEAGGDPNTRDDDHGVPALYAVTGHRDVPRIARMLLEAGANPTDGESVYHAAERYHVEALELLLEFGADLNHTGDWGNAPLHFLLEWWDVAADDNVARGFGWLLDHGADPDVRSGNLRETALHAAARRGQSADVVRLLIERGADVAARRADGRTAWALAARAGLDEAAAALRDAGAPIEELSPADAMLAACGRGDSADARRRTSGALLASLDEESRRFMVDAAALNRSATVLASLAAGFATDLTDGRGATALHHAAIHGNAMVVRALLEHGADWRIRDGEHASSPLGWACFGADVVADQGGDYPDTVRALVEAGARPAADEHWPGHPGVAALLEAIPR